MHHFHLLNPSGPSPPNLTAPLLSHLSRSSNQLDRPPRLLDLPLRFLREIPRTHHNRNLRQTTFTKNFGVAEGEQVEDGSGVGGFFGQVGGAFGGGD